MRRTGAAKRSRYRNPATLPGLLVELMCPPCEGSARDTANAVKEFRHTSKGGPCGAPGERLHPRPNAGVAKRHPCDPLKFESARPCTASLESLRVAITGENRRYHSRPGAAGQDSGELQG